MKSHTHWISKDLLLLLLWAPKSWLDCARHETEFNANRPAMTCLILARCPVVWINKKNRHFSSFCRRTLHTKDLSNLTFTPLAAQRYINSGGADSQLFRFDRQCRQEALLLTRPRSFACTSKGFLSEKPDWTLPITTTMLWTRTSAAKRRGQ